MYRIALCDDEPAFLETERLLMELILKELEITDYEIRCFSSGMELLEAMYATSAYVKTNHEQKNESMEFQLILMDILLLEEDGVNIAKRIRERNDKAGIIFVSSSPDYILDGYDVQAIQYFIKPLDKSRLKKAVQFNYEEVNQNKKLVFKTKSDLHVIFQREVVYFEILRNDLTVHLEDGSRFLTTASLTETQKRLPQKQFVRCHKSYCVNLEYVVRIKRYALYLKNGGILPVSKMNYKMVQEAFLKYLG